jgi:hypothetical protein
MMEKDKELPWITEAQQFIDLCEISGPQHAHAIIQMWRDTSQQEEI